MSPRKAWQTKGLGEPSRSADVWLCVEFLGQRQPIGLEMNGQMLVFIPSQAAAILGEDANEPCNRPLVGALINQTNIYFAGRQGSTASRPFTQT
jgi:hypothetical protein